MRLKFTLLLALTGCLNMTPGSLAGQPSTPPVGTPTLAFVTVAGYLISVSGQGWDAQAHLTFGLEQAAGNQTLPVTTSGRGTLLVGINNLDLCSRFKVRVRDDTHEITLDGPPRACPPAATPPTPTLTVLEGNGIEMGPTPIPTGFADPAFERLWVRSDQLVAHHKVQRSWLWGPAPATGALTEPYQQGNNGLRLVQYFDKSRMEITHPDGDRRRDFYVTNGLLVRELIEGRVQTGDATYQIREPSMLNLVGDTDDLTAPTYASLGAVASTSGHDRRAPDRTGQLITATISRAGSVSIDEHLREAGIQMAHYEAGIGHNIPSIFWNVLQARGPVIEDGTTIEAALTRPWFYASGLPISEAYWARVRVRGQPTDVLIQAFERRVLTYTPTNSVPFQVEMGNVGQHYYLWRYGATPSADARNHALPSVGLSWSWSIATQDYLAFGQAHRQRKAAVRV